LPTKGNLIAHSITSHENQLCVTGFGEIEIAEHLFLSCPFLTSLWSFVRVWLGISSTDLYHLQDHLIQFVYSSGGSRVRRFVLQLVWLCCVWDLWNERNNRTFKNKECFIHHLLDKVTYIPFGV